MDATRFEVLEPCACALGEGPAFDPQTQTATWFDITGKKLFVHDLASGETVVRDLPLMASMLARTDDPKGRVLLATETGLQLFDMRDGALEMVCPIEAEEDRTRSNDSRAHPSGAFWTSTMSKSGRGRHGAIYVFSAGELHRIESDWAIANCISFTADGRFANYVDTADGRVWRRPVDPRTGLPTGERELFRDYRDSDRSGHPDGAVMDADDVLHIAIYGGGRIDRFDRDGNELPPLTGVGAEQTTCPCFVGENASSLLVTTANQGQDEEARARDPKGGHTFILRGGFKGRFDPPVRLGS